jgi:peptidyl-prolyl cis-trans isomerase D
MAKRKGPSFGLWIVVGLLVIGLGGWYTGGAGGRTTAIGSVDGLDIPVQSYGNALRDRLRSFEEQTGQPLTAAQAQALGLDRAVLAQVVSTRVLDAEAQRLGLSADDQRVAEAVRSTSAFQGLDGQFDRAAYREVLRRNGLSETAYETSLREGTARTILQAAVLGGLPEPRTYAEVLAAYGNERRDVTWARLDGSSVAVQPQPTDEDLRAYYDANPATFTAPEIREISYAWLTPEMIQDDMNVDDAAVRELYDSRIDEFVQEERRLVERLVFPSEEAAQEAKARIDAGEATFEQVAEERGLELSDIDLGDVGRADLDEAGEAVFAAQSGDLLGPLPSSLGPALFRVNAILAADETSFEDAAPDLRAELATDQARDVIGDLVPQIEDLVAGGATIEDLAERTDLEAGQIAWSEDVTDGPAAYSEFRSAAAAAEVGAFPKVTTLEDGGLFVLRLDSVTPPALRPFEEVEPEVRKAWEAQALGEALLAQAETSAQAIADGATFEDQGLTPQAEAGLTRRSAIEGTAPEFIATAFSLEPGQTRAIATDDGAIILRVDGVTPAPEDDPAVVAEREALASQVSGSISGDLFDAFVRKLQGGAEIRIDDQAVAAVNAQFN